MEIVHTVKDLQAGLSALRAQGKKVGLVPTMGALHAGHASLVKRCVAENDAAVVSVFVNPTQFNDQNDLIKYPRTPEADCRLLEECGAAFVFAPAVEEMYPEPDTRQFSYAPLDTVMEGAFRPGHFNGVCQIVSKLFDAVQPDRAYFGEKDFQQLAIIREMVRQMKYPLEIVGCPIVREEDGLALSSRNARLSDEERKNALKISQTLFESRTFAASHTVAETQKFVEDAIAAAPGLRLEYFELVDGNTLQKIADWEDTSYAVGCITVFCGEVRLIDNIKYKVDVNTMEKLSLDNGRLTKETLPMQLNQIARVVLTTAKELFFDPYQTNKATGSFILIDPITNNTSAVGMIIDRVEDKDMHVSEELPVLDLPKLGIAPEHYEAVEKAVKELERQGVAVIIKK